MLLLVYLSHPPWEEMTKALRAISKVGGRGREEEDDAGSSLTGIESMAVVRFGS